jgi:ABC-2 type transport system ATP-binding protein
LFSNPHLLDYSQAEGDTTFRNVLEHPKEIKRLFGFAAQRPSVYGKLTLLENLDLFGSMYDLSKDARVTNSKILLKLMGLWDSRNTIAEKLSGGMMKRLDIACALIHDPKILILDEPTADLDPYLRKQMWYLIRKINSKGTTIILSSHFLDELEELCDRIGITHQGKMENCGTPAELKRLYKAGEEVHISTVQGKYGPLEEHLEKLKTKLKITEVTNMGHELIIKTHKPVEVLRDVVTALKDIEDEILDLRMSKPSLNQVFENIIQTQEDLNAEAELQEANKAKKKGEHKIWWFPFGSKKKNSKADSAEAETPKAGEEASK